MYRLGKIDHVHHVYIYGCVFYKIPINCIFCKFNHGGLWSVTNLLLAICSALVRVNKIN